MKIEGVRDAAEKERHPRDFDGACYGDLYLSTAQPPDFRHRALHGNRSLTKRLYVLDPPVNDRHTGVAARGRRLEKQHGPRTEYLLVHGSITLTRSDIPDTLGLYIMQGSEEPIMEVEDEKKQKTINRGILQSTKVASHTLTRAAQRTPTMLSPTVL